VEYFRKYHRYDKRIYVDSPNDIITEHENYYKKYPGADWDPANFFGPYASRYSLTKDGYVNSPKPTSTQLKVTVDSILYSEDSLLCVAFLVLELKYDSIKGLENKRKEGRNFDGKVIIGFRKSKENSFQIYPVENYSVIGYEDYEEAAKELEYFYFKKLKNTSLGGIYTGLKFKQNVGGGKDFFEKSPYFQKHKSGLYNFQMYRHLGKEKPYAYLNCSRTDN
jgi:hypothetical protein